MFLGGLRRDRNSCPWRKAYSGCQLTTRKPQNKGRKAPDCCFCCGYYWRVGRPASILTGINANSLTRLLFLLTAIHAILLNRHHKKEKRKGPSPSNNYTSGAGKTSFFKRNRKQKTNRDAEELGALGGGSALITEEKAHNNQHHSNDVRPSHDTGVTGTTVPVAETGYGGSVNKYSNEYASQQPNSRYNAYVPPESGTTQTHTHSHNPSHPYNGTAYGQGTTQPGMVVYDPEPYATVHGDGSPHQAKPGD